MEDDKRKSRDRINGLRAKADMFYAATISAGVPKLGVFHDRVRQDGPPFSFSEVGLKVSQMAKELIGA